MKAFLLGSVCLLTACASVHTQPIITADGKHGYSIECSGSRQTWGACYSQAGDKCRNGYVILERTAEGASSIGAVEDVAVGRSSMQRNMIIQCK